MSHLVGAPLSWPTDREHHCLGSYRERMAARAPSQCARVGLYRRENPRLCRQLAVSAAQVDLMNEEFPPTQREIHEAQSLLRAIGEPNRRGRDP